MTEEIVRTGGCLCGKSRYQTKGDSPRAIMCHCRYCQTYTGSAFGTQVWFPEDKVTLTSGELSKYENNTESGNVVTLNFCRTKAPFIQTSTAEKHDTHPMYNPKTPDNHPVK